MSGTFRAESPNGGAGAGAGARRGRRVAAGTRPLRAGSSRHSGSQPHQSRRRSRDVGRRSRGWAHSRTGRRRAAPRSYTDRPGTCWAARAVFHGRPPRPGGSPPPRQPGKPARGGARSSAGIGRHQPRGRRRSATPTVGLGSRTAAGSVAPRRTERRHGRPGGSPARPPSPARGREPRPAGGRSTASGSVFDDGARCGLAAQGVRVVEPRRHPPSQCHRRVCARPPRPGVGRVPGRLRARAVTERARRTAGPTGGCPPRCPWTRSPRRTADGRVSTSSSTARRRPTEPAPVTTS